jgi:hypothetical protein
LFNLVANLLTSQHREVRDQAAAVVKRLSRLQEDLPSHLIRAFYITMRSFGPQDVNLTNETKRKDAAKTASTSAPEQKKPKTSPDALAQARSVRYVNALRTCLYSEGDVLSETRQQALSSVVPFVLVLAHHPFILPSHQLTAWKSSLRVMRISLSVCVAAPLAKQDLPMTQADSEGRSDGLVSEIMTFLFSDKHNSDVIGGACSIKSIIFT